MRLDVGLEAGHAHVTQANQWVDKAASHRRCSTKCLNEFSAIILHGSRSVDRARWASEEATEIRKEAARDGRQRTQTESKIREAIEAGGERDHAAATREWAFGQEISSRSTWGLQRKAAALRLRFEGVGQCPGSCVQVTFDSYTYDLLCTYEFRGQCWLKLLIWFSANRW